MDKYAFGNKLYKLRTESNLTQKELANILGVSDKAVSKWETGEAMPRVKTLKNIADCFSVTYEELLSQTDELKTSETEKYEAYENFYRKRVGKIKKDINEHTTAILLGTILLFIIKIVLFLQAEIVGISINLISILFGEVGPLISIIGFFVTLKKYLKSEQILNYKQYSYLYFFLEASIDFQLMAGAIGFITDSSNIYVFLCNIIISAVLSFLGLWITKKYKKGKNVNMPKREIMLYTGILLLMVIVAQLLPAESVFSAVSTTKTIFVNFFSLFIMYEIIEYQSLLEMKKEPQEKTDTKVKRNIKRIVAVCLVIVLSFSVLVLFVPGFIFKTLAQRSPVATPDTLFYDELAISFENETLTEYTVEDIKFALPDEYELLGNIENERTTGLKFGKKGSEEVLFTVTHNENMAKEPLDIPSELFSGEKGEETRKMIKNTFGYVPSTNMEYFRLLYSINPDDANVFDIEECITYFVMVKTREIYTWNGSDEMEFFDNGIFQAEITKSKGVTLNEKKKIEIDESGKYERLSANVTFYSDEYKDGYYQIYYRPETAGTADYELLHKVLNTVEKAE